MKKYRYTEEELKKDLHKITREMALDNWKPDVIIAPVRGGLVPGVYLSHYFNVPLEPISLSLRDFKNDSVNLTVLNKYKNILVIDDILDSGETFDILQHRFVGYSHDRQFKTETLQEIRYSTLFYNIANKFDFTPDYYANEMNKSEEDVWIEFPFETWFAK